MKKIILVTLLAFLLTGCAESATSEVSTQQTIETQKVTIKEGYKTYNRNGISFEYPDYLTVSEDGKAYDKYNITVVKKPVTDFIDDCKTDDGDDSDLSDRNEELERLFTEGLSKLKSIGINEEIYRVDNIGCGWTAGNIRTTPFDIGDMHGVIFINCPCQDSGGFNFYMQLLAVDEYDQVYTITSSFDFGDVEKYLKNYRQILAKQDGNISDKYFALDEELLFYFQGKGQLKSKELFPYKENVKTIIEIFKTVKIES